MFRACQFTLLQQEDLSGPSRELWGDLLERPDPFLLVVMLTRAGGPALATDSWGGGTQPCPLWGSVPLDSGGTALGRSVARLLGEGRVKEQAPPPLPLGARQTHLHSLEWLLLSLASGGSHFLVLSSEPWAFTRAL